MRKILFKARRKDNREWVEGNAFFADNGQCEICIGTPIIRITYEVDPDTVCQYTGLTDKNGNKIFEGDRLSDEYGDTGEVKFGWNYGTYGFYLDGTVDDITEKDLIIIGNIHDEEGKE